METHEDEVIRVDTNPMTGALTGGEDAGQSTRQHHVITRVEGRVTNL